MSGIIEVYCGPMFSGKSTIITSEILKARNQGLNVLALKPSFDTRYGSDVVSTHSKLQVEVKSVSEYPITDVTPYDVVFLDEVQFFDEPYFHSDIIRLVQFWRRNGTRVVAAGLDMTWNGAPFAVTAQLCAMADSVTKLKAVCSVCGHEASKTEKVGWFMKTDTNLVELGGTGTYSAKCNQHWAAPVPYDNTLTTGEAAR